MSSNQYGWNTKANLLFIDQPIGVGYSLGDPSKYPTNQDMVKQNFVQFIEGWLALPEFAEYRKRPIFISGESYAGHYIP